MVKGFIVISIIIVLVILILTLFVTKKAYQYKHTIDPPQDNPLHQDLPNHNREEDL